METQVNSNGWSDHHETTLLTSTATKQQYTYQFVNGSSIKNFLSNKTSNINKNHNCKLPFVKNGAQQTYSAKSDQSDTNHRNGTANGNGIFSHEKCRNIFSNSNNSFINSKFKSNTTNNKISTSNLYSSSTSKDATYEEPSYHIVLMCYLSYLVLTVFGYFRDFMRKTGLEVNLAAVERKREVYI